MRLLTQHVGGVLRRCDARCYNATHGRCSCICGGENHGVGLERALANTLEQLPPHLLPLQLQDQLPLGGEHEEG